VEFQRRKYPRLRSNSPCILFESEEKGFQATIENISMGGALIKLNDRVSLSVGDVCDLMMFNASLPLTTKHTCKVISRTSQVTMGVQFISCTFPQ
jgi:c-di-GMP-binding flagellar brake protein YcgR